MECSLAITPTMSPATMLAGYHPYQVRREIVMMRGCLCTNIVTYLDAFIKPHDGLAKLWANP